jgi:nitrogen regulatory protein PII
MKQIKAFIHPHRINSVTEALRQSGLCDISNGAGCYNLTVSTVQRLFTSGDPSQQRYSVDLAEPVVAEAKLELVCEDNLADQLIALIAQSGRPGPGWIFSTDIGTVQKIV